MGKVYFKVLTKQEDPKKEVSIRIRFKEGKIDQATSSGESVKLQHWDLEKQKLKRTSFKGKDQMISRLTKLEAHILVQASKTDQIETGWLFKIVDQHLHPKKYVKMREQSMFDWIETWISNSKNSYHAVRPYHSALKDLKEFQPDLGWDQVNMAFYYDFVDYLIELEYSKNTIGSRIKNLKVFCNAAMERNIHQNSAFKSFKKPTEESFNIYLNEEELDIIFNQDLESSPHLDRVRDIFLVGCWTGCRFSDLSKVNKDFINGNFIHMEHQKSEYRVVIPLHSVVKAILNKYDGTLPKMISNQNFNEYIKKVCENAGFSNKITKSITKGGRRITEVKEKWEMVASHTARRSFATNLYKSGFPSISIMAITGHKTEKAFLSYIKVSQEEHAEMLMKHWEKSIK